jgi:transaldolase
MEEQALKIASWGDNVFVKIPVTNTHGDPTDDVIRRLSRQGVQLNVTALMTLEQVARVAECLDGGKSSYVSVFAGRIADTGRDPVPLMSEAVEIVEQGEAIELIWASPREILNIFQADSIGCHIITVTHDLLAKLASVERDLDEFSLATVRMFHSDAAVAGYQI